MPVDLEAHCKRILDNIVTTSQSIRRSALIHANGQNLQASQRLRSQLETIRISADAILEIITEASFTDYTIDDGLVDWLFSGELRSCSGKLKEIDAMLKPLDPVRPVRCSTRPLGLGEDKLAAAMAFFDRHKGLFHFLTTPDIWNREGLLHQLSGSEARAPQISAPPVPEDTGYHAQEIQSSSESSHTPKIRHLKESHRRQLEEILRWLAALDCTDKHDYMHQLRQEGTCKWFPNTNVYGEWRTRGAQFLWLHGKAGCGKSVLVASTIEHLKTTLQYEEVVIFFYFDFQNERSRSPVEMMRSLLSQLCRHLLDLGVDPGNFPNMLLEEKGEGTLSLNDLDKLRGLVSFAAERFVREPIVVIDALDECADVESLLRALLTLYDDNRIRLLITSRPHQDMMRHFTKYPSLSFKDVAKELAADIELHIGREIGHNQLKFASPEMKKEIHTKLNEKAEGRFRWVQCQIDILKQCTTALELKKALDSLPSELEATYERILDAIDERKLEGHLARRVLNWLIVALEPLRLAQIVDALSADFPSRRNIIREGVELIAMLSSLVSHCQKTDVVSLSHFSVKEFLTSPTTLPMYQIVLCEAHAAVVQSCMRYISGFLKQAPFLKNVGASKSWPMLSYVFSSGFHHLGHINPESTVVLDLLQSLGSDVRHHPSHWDLLCQLREEDRRLLYPLWPLSRHDFVFYILIAYASTGLLQTYLSSHQPIKARVGTNPLVYAADLRRTRHAILLLACSTDINARSLAIDDSHHVSPLEVSINRNEDVLVNELLQRGCVVTSELLTTAIYLPWCNARVLVKLTQTDEFVEWAHSIRDETLYHGIFNSARPNVGDIKKADKDHVALARRLRQTGRDLPADSPFGVVLIKRALYAAHTSMFEYLLPPDKPPPAQFLLEASTGDTPETVSVVRFLLRKGADANAVTSCGDTVLHLAAMCPWEPRSLELTGVFIDAGCNPHVTNSRGETSLTIAVRRGYASVVERLLSCIIPPPPYGVNVHSIAASTKHQIGESYYMYGGFAPNTDPWSNYSLPDSGIKEGHGEVIPPWNRRTYLVGNLPEHTARQHSDERNFASALGTRREVLAYQPSGSSVNAGNWGAIRTGRLQPVFMHALPSDPVPPPTTTFPTRSRGEWWGPPDAHMSRCWWTTTDGKPCEALISGDRRSVTSHLRDRHGDFSSDGKTIACAWAGCTVSMQRRNIPRHILACHLEVKVTCPGCGMVLHRATAGKRHQQVCPGALDADLGDEGIY